VPKRQANKHEKVREEKNTLEVLLLTAKFTEMTFFLLIFF